MESADTLTDLESRIAAACRELIGYRGQIGPDTSVNFDMGIVGDDSDMLSGEIIASTGLAIGPDLQRHNYFGTEGFWHLRLLFDGLKISKHRLEPLTVRQIAEGLIDDPVLAAQQLAGLNEFWRRNWTLPERSAFTSRQE